MKVLSTRLERHWASGSHNQTVAPPPRNFVALGKLAGRGSGSSPAASHPVGQGARRGGAPWKSASCPSASSARKAQQAARPAGRCEGPATPGAWLACGPLSGLAAKASGLASALPA